MELKKINERVYYIPGNVNIGVVKDKENSVVLIDSGLDDENSKKILKLLEENSLSVKAILNTHSHADHCGGNKYIKEKTNARIYAPEFESAIVEYPLLEPLYFFSGASPLKDLRSKFLMAQPSDVDYVIKKDEKLRFDEVELDIISLKGHSLNQIGVGIDEVLFCADAIFSEDVVDKHKIPFFMDVEKTKESLKFLKNSRYRFYVPSHAEPRESLTKLVDINLDVIDGVEKYILENFDRRKTTEEVLKGVCDSYQISINSIQQYYLMNTVVMAYLSYLYKKGKLKVNVEGNSLFWEKN